MNLVFVDAQPTAVIDFDMAAPGPRAWDAASAVYRTAPLHAPELFEQWNLPVPVLDSQLNRAATLLAAYGDVPPRTSWTPSKCK